MALTLVQQIQQTKLIKDNDCLLVGLSGGPDSVCLLHALTVMREYMSLTIYAAHLNHNLRGMDANRDAVFAMDFSKKLGVHCLVKSEDVEAVARKRKLSIEAAARLCRYRFLNEVAEKTGSGKIVVAHHLNDQAETLLLHLIRGSGLTGLVGMVSHRGKVIRPLLGVTREMILQYCDQHQLSYCKDATNDEPVVMRNRIRLELLPLMKTYNPEVIQALGRTAQLLGRDEAALDQMAEESLASAELSTDAGIYDNTELRRLPDAVLSRVIRKIWQKEMTAAHTLQAVHVNTIISALRKPVQEKCFQLPGEIFMRVTTKALWCQKPVEESSDARLMGPVHLNLNGLTWLPQGRGSVSCRRHKADHPVRFSSDPNRQVISADQLTAELVIRQRKPGELWQPLGLGGMKSLKKTLMEMGIPRIQRDDCLLLCHRDQVIWVLGGPIGEICRVTSKTMNLLVLEYHPRVT
jgi:tRNA(Ile)-lysidine synthase